MGKSTSTYEDVGVLSSQCGGVLFVLSLRDWEEAVDPRPQCLILDPVGKCMSPGGNEDHIWALPHSHFPCLNVTIVWGLLFLFCTFLLPLAVDLTLHW